MRMWSHANQALEESDPIVLRGTVTDVTGLIIEAHGPVVGIGTTCMIVQGASHSTTQRLPAQVVGFRKDKILLMPYGETNGIAPGAVVEATQHQEGFRCHEGFLGRVIDPLGKPLDGGPSLVGGEDRHLYQAPPNPLLRSRIKDPFDVGIKIMNSLLTVGVGQRVAIMAGSGVGKSTFLGMVAKHAKSDVNVIALVGERGREVREFIERDLGPEGMARSVLIVSTSDSSALLRIRAAFVATALAEYFRDQGKTVTLMVDSITRFCMALREVGLAVGEPPSTAGYTPSVFATLPKLLERAGTKEGAGAITDFYTVLVEGDDMNEPVADAVRGIVDGHVVLSRKLAGRVQYPAVEVLQSISRVMSEVVSPEKLELARRARTVLADYQDSEDLITIGAYREGQNPKVDYAVKHIDKVRQFLMQKPEEGISLENSDGILHQILGGA